MSELMTRVVAATLELPGSRKSIAEFLLREGSGIANLSMAEVADLTFTSKPSLVRFAKAMGFLGWRDFRLAFISEVSESEAALGVGSNVDPNYPFDAGDDTAAVVQNVSLLERQAIADALQQLDKAMLDEAATRVVRARSLVFFGAAPNSYFGELFAYKLEQIGIACHVPNEDEWPIVARGLSEDDCAIVASYSGAGKHRPPVSFVSMFNERRVPVVAITNSGSNWLREQCDCVLSFRPIEHYYSKISGYYSEQCVRFVLDALYSVCFAMDYDKNEVARIRMLLAYERKLQQHVEDVLPY